MTYLVGAGASNVCEGKYGTRVSKVAMVKVFVVVSTCPPDVVVAVDIVVWKDTDSMSAALDGNEPLGGWFS